MSGPSSPSRRPGLRVGSFGGAPIYLSGGLLIAAVVLAVLVAPGMSDLMTLAPGGGAPILASIAFAVLFLGSVLVHELAHGTVARWCGIEVRAYTLTFWGGHTTFTALDRPGASAAVSAAGPVSNLALAGLGWLVLQAPLPEVAGVILASLVYANVVLAVLNLLPVPPLDGGHLLEAVIWGATGERGRAMVIVGWVGRLLAVLTLGAVVASAVRGAAEIVWSVWLVLIAVVLWTSATRSIRVGRARQAARGFDLRPFLRPAAVMTTEDPLPGQRGEGEGSLGALPPIPWGMSVGLTVVVDGDGAVVGILDADALAAIPPQARAGLTVASVVRRVPSAGVRSLRGADALAEISRALAGGDVAVVTGAHGVLGTVWREDVVRALGDQGAAGR
ncbi:site-2 protease family protein [Serinibacter salmoneus]|uniref:Zn-dependent protease n=1 Tax=Serinibacter salmoneus TaxID=556530 RepID=A0A2A9D072_9MICO|nr:site-2 protease family protein [Serinibacter salmoneus]PFG19776.1 Zn-dependent protease [Serinibacter salmoneus]